MCSLDPSHSSKAFPTALMEPTCDRWISWHQFDLDLWGTTPCSIPPMSSANEAGDVGTFVPDRDPVRPEPMAWEPYSAAVFNEWQELLASDPEESGVHAFLELHPAMIPGGSGDIGPGGHHGSDFSAVFTKPRLKGQGRDFEPDFMWVTRSTGLITPVLIEIEEPSKRWFRKDGRPTSEFTEAHDQLNDWRSWFKMDANKALFRSTFLIEGELFLDRPIEPQFVLIYGRQSEFELGGGHEDPAGLRRKRDGQRARDESFMTFDSLRPRYDHRNSVTVRMTATGPEAVAFSPVYGTSPKAGHLARNVRRLPDALVASVMMTEERRKYLARRFEYWHQRDESARRNDGPNICQPGYE